MATEPVKVGLVGFGKVAEVFHAPLLAVEPGLRLTHVVERHRRRSQELYPEIEVLRSLAELLERDVDLIVILTPNETHYPLAREALLHNKHVVLDKPMTLSSREADDLVALSVKQGKILTVFHNRRWDGDFLTLKKLLQEERLGRLVELESHFDRFRPQLKGGWREEERPGAGVLYDLGSHLIDQALQLFGPPSTVFACLRKEREEAKVEDAFDILLDYGKLQVNLSCTCLLAEEPKLRFRARGTQGNWRKFGLDPQEGALLEKRLPRGPHWGEEEPHAWGQIFDGAKEGSEVPSQAGNYPAFYRLLAQAIRDGAEPPVSASEAADVIRLIELCLLSHREGRIVSCDNCTLPNPPK